MEKAREFQNAWWWCDHAFGIKNTLESIASFGAVSQFIGMTTDSRSILSFVRHDYFRRLLCSWLADKNSEGEWGLSLPALSDIAARISYKNARLKIEKQILSDTGEKSWISILTEKLP